MKSVLVTGISGFLGWHVAKFRQHRWRIIGLYNKSATNQHRYPTYQVDFRDTDHFFDLIDHIEPDAIMHLAAMSSPADCEKHIDQSYRTNVVIPTLLAEYARARNIPFVFCSSDMVFDGQLAPYGPYDYTHPLSTYGKEKAEAEKRILAIYRHATIARLPLLHGLSPSGNNFTQDWLNKMTNGHSIRAFSDEFRSTISGEDAAKGLFLLLNQRLPHIWHLGNRKTYSRYDFGCILAETFGFSTDLIVPTTLEEAGLDGKRPADLTLDSQMTFDMGFQPTPVEESLRALRKLAY